MESGNWHDIFQSIQPLPTLPSPPNGTPRASPNKKKDQGFYIFLTKNNSKSQKGKGHSLERTKPILYLSHIIISQLPHFSSNHLRHKKPRFKYPKPNPQTPQAEAVMELGAESSEVEEGNTIEG